MEDTKKELERLQKALLADETMVGEDLTEDLPDDLVEGMDDAAAAHLLEELSQEMEEPESQEAPSVTDETLLVDDAMLDALLAEVNSSDFDDPDTMGVSDETMVFHNFSNGYGEDLDGYGEPEPEGEPDEETKKRDDKIVIGLMIAGCALCLGILGVLIYWLVAFL